MLTHERIWQAVDALAQRHSMTASALARKAGLDPTTFNKSKRLSADGHRRWPSTESVAKILAATGSEFGEFVAVIDGPAKRPVKPLPLIGLAQAGTGGFFGDGGFPVGAGWDEVAFPQVQDEHAYALEISGESMMPVYRDGDIVIVSPAAPLRRGDRVVVRTTEGEVMAKELRRRTSKTVELRSLNPDHVDRTIPVENLSWIARIVWSSQ
ncbi:MAG: helix-turn-helix transcriptional regulator [Hyphomicrobiales bacterium]|nr:helix-turn-helix transcriptional regulator [Hyphomicrobiales bacterium]MDE2016711.1 helix-turn-helix transcriptional regulator [Hyphomicrobiales bacterium]